MFQGFTIENNNNNNNKKSSNKKNISTKLGFGSRIIVIVAKMYYHTHTNTCILFLLSHNIFFSFLPSYSYAMSPSSSSSPLLSTTTAAVTLASSTCKYIVSRRNKQLTINDKCAYDLSDKVYTYASYLHMQINNHNSRSSSNNGGERERERERERETII